MEVPTTYYVYTYAYPDGKVFYVGKGCNGRINDHEIEAKGECECKKCKTIREIWTSGHPVQKRFVFETFDEQEALLHERELVTSFPSEQLTNIRMTNNPNTNRGSVTQKIIRNIPDDVMQSLEIQAVEAGKGLETYLRDFFTSLARKTGDRWLVTYWIRGFDNQKVIKRTQLVTAPTADEARKFVKETDDELLKEKRITVVSA